MRQGLFLVLLYYKCVRSQRPFVDMNWPIEIQNSRHVFKPFPRYAVLPGPRFSRGIGLLLKYCRGLNFFVRWFG